MTLEIADPEVHFLIAGEAVKSTRFALSPVKITQVLRCLKPRQLLNKYSEGYANKRYYESKF